MMMKSAPECGEQNHRLDVVPEHVCHLAIGNVGIQNTGGEPGLPGYGTSPA